MLIITGLIFSPAAIADAGWEEDGWLNTNLAQERLNNGDEFGCYEIPGLSWKADPGAVANECRSISNSEPKQTTGVQTLFRPTRQMG